MHTVAQASQQLKHRSFWFEKLCQRAAPIDIGSWLIEEANLRGYFGAFVGAATRSAPAGDLSDEEVLIGLVGVHATLDARVLKLVVRMMQSGRIDAQRLQWWARRERATATLHWLLTLVPDEERADLQAFSGRFATPPRGYRGMHYAYDPSRLIRRRATRDTWRIPQK